MASVLSISEYLERQSVLLMESTIPGAMTIDEWRRQRSARPCDHLHESTSRYDHDKKLLTFLLVCPVCRTEKVMETQRYEPRFTPTPVTGSGGATVHQLPVRRPEQPARRAA